MTADDYGRALEEFDRLTRRRALALMAVTFPLMVLPFAALWLGWGARAALASVGGAVALTMVGGLLITRSAHADADRLGLRCPLCRQLMVTTNGRAITRRTGQCASCRTPVLVP